MPITEPPFTFTGKLKKITLSIDRPKLSPEDVKRLQGTARAAGDGPSTEAAAASAGGAVLHPTGDTPAPLVDKIEMRIEKREACRKEALAEDLGFVERMRFIHECMK